MRFRIYILLAAAFLWFVFASVFMYRSTWGLEDALVYRNAVVEFGMQDKVNQTANSMFTFKLDGMPDKFGIYRRKFSAYDTFKNNIQIGDTLTAYYGVWKHKEGNVITELVQLEKNEDILIDYTVRKRKDTIIAVILYIICSVSLVFAWILNQKRLRKIRSIGMEFYGLGMYSME